MSMRSLTIFCYLLLVLLVTSVQAQLANQLKDHPSPYLAMHGEDPVHWQDWGAEVLARARVENKMLFISSGYFACHWCHVMQRESYQDPEVAALLNRYFIPVKVDRELQPALDAHLIDFVQKTRGRAGWPLNVFLSPEGYPVVGFTYKPKGAFLALLFKLHNVWEKEHERLKALARRAGEETEETVDPQFTAAPVQPIRLRSRLIASALKLGDEMEGGFGRQNKFPMAPQLSVLLDSLRQQPNSELRKFLLLTLDQMASQGLRDHLGGGFFRYTVDPGWQIPHFEKMLYTQAQLIPLYLQAAQVLERPEYRIVARDTLDFVLREMAGTGGAYIASFSAVDATGEEGGNYLWGKPELEALLTPKEWALARKRWHLEGSPAHEGGYLPVTGMTLKELAETTGSSVQQLESTLAAIQARLLKARSQRTLPRDTKQLAAWNGLMLSAMVQAAAEFKDASYKQASIALRNYLVENLWDGKQLLRARTRQGALGTAGLEDYVYLAQGLASLDDLLGKPRDRRLVLQLIEQAWKRFYAQRGWRSFDDNLLPGQVLATALPDGPLPSPAAILIELSLRFADQAEVMDLKPLARTSMAQSSRLVGQQPFWYATQASVLLREVPVKQKNEVIKGAR